MLRRNRTTPDVRLLGPPKSHGTRNVGIRGVLFAYELDEMFEEKGCVLDESFDNGVGGIGAIYIPIFPPLLRYRNW